MNMNNNNTWAMHENRRTAVEKDKEHSGVPIGSDSRV
jgi:hypothetical protein